MKKRIETLISIDLYDTWSDNLLLKEHLIRGTYQNDFSILEKRFFIKHHLINKNGKLTKKATKLCKAIDEKTLTIRQLENYLRKLEDK